MRKELLSPQDQPKKYSMPIPSPRANEPQKDYVSRCYSEISQEYDRAGAFAICYSKWREKKMMQIAKLKRKP